MVSSNIHCSLCYAKGLSHNQDVLECASLHPCVYKCTKAGGNLALMDLHAFEVLLISSGKSTIEIFN